MEIVEHCNLSTKLISSVPKYLGSALWPMYTRESKDNELFKSFKCPCTYEDKHLNKREKEGKENVFKEEGKKIG